MNVFIGTTDLFGPVHLAGIAICAAIVVLSIVFHNKLNLQIWNKILLITGIVSETLKVFSYIVNAETTFGGYLPKTDLPFQLCSIQLIFIAILNFSKNDKLKKMLMAFMIPTCLIGGAAAIFIATYSSRNMPIVFFQYFVYHGVIVAFAVHLMRSKEVKFDFKDYINTLLMLAFIAMVAIYLNSICTDVVGYTTNANGELVAIYGYKLDELGNLVPKTNPQVNFMYLLNPPTDGLPLLNKDHGWLPYVVHYAFIAIVAISLVYIKQIIEKIKGCFSKKEEAPAQAE